MKTFDVSCALLCDVSCGCVCAGGALGAGCVKHCCSGVPTNNKCCWKNVRICVILSIFRIHVRTFWEI